MGTTPTLALPYPELSDTADIPRDLKALADALDAQSLAPPGVIQMWPGVTEPTGWFLCRGQSVPAADNPKLATLFGTVGANVVLPDLQGRLPLGAGSYPRTAPAPALNFAVRDKGGEPKIKLTAAESGLPVHGHNDTLAVDNKAAFNTGNDGPDHTHNYTAPGSSALVVGNPSGSSLARAGVAATSAGANQRHQHSVPIHGHTLSGAVSNSVSANASAEHENLPPYYAINFIIRAG